MRTFFLSLSLSDLESNRGPTGEVGTGKNMEWFEDPIFDNAEERFCGKLFKGESWRALQFLRDRGLVKDVIFVAGTTFRRDAVKGVQHHSKVKLEPEPTNQHDPNALKVVVSGEHVGYIPRDKPISPCARVNLLKWGMDPTPHVWLAVAEVGA